MAITVTEAAARHIEKSLTRRGKGIGIRLGVQTSGCSGMAYKLEFVDVTGEEDQVFELSPVAISGSFTILSPVGSPLPSSL